MRTSHTYRQVPAPGDEAFEGAAIPPELERQTEAGETPINYDLFLKYLRQGLHRGYGRLAHETGIDLRHIERTGSKFGWARRARVFDDLWQRAQLRDVLRDACLRTPPDALETKKAA